MAAMWQRLKKRLQDQADQASSSHVLKDIGRLNSYHGAMNRKKAVSKLRHGSSNCHLIRYSAKHQSFRVSVKYTGEDDKPIFQHYVLNVDHQSRDVNRYNIDGTGTTYTNITELLCYYEDFPVGIEPHGIGKGIRRKNSGANLDECHYRNNGDRANNEQPRPTTGPPGTEKTAEKTDVDITIYFSRPTIAELTLIKWKDVTGEVRRFKLVQQISAEWYCYNLGIRLGQETSLEGYRRRADINNDERTIAVLSSWMQSGHDRYNLTWNGMCELLEDIGKNDIAQQLRDVLSKKQAQGTNSD